MGGGGGVAGGEVEAELLKGGVLGLAVLRPLSDLRAEVADGVVEAALVFVVELDLEVGLGWVGEGGGWSDV